MEKPNEACGYISGVGEKAEEIYPMSNIDKSPEHFSFDPMEQFKAVKAARSKGYNLIAVYHSHPETPARMSEEDTRLAFDPDMIYIIYSVLEDDIRAYKLEENGVIQFVSLEVMQ